ncbi:MAG: RNA methyltransferase [Firmicutes bacterium]|nr:RNA methyltransferase [Bacillota bacterium]
MMQNITKITSRQNEIIKAAAKLNDKKYRNSTGTVLIEGERMVADAARSGVEFVSVFFVEDKRFPKFPFAREGVAGGALAETDGVAAAISGAKTNFYHVTPQVMEVITNTVSPSGIAAVVKLTKHEFRMPAGNFLVLDRISDAGNIGTIIRTAAACGITDIYAINCVDYLNPKALRSSMGAVFKVHVHEATEAQVLEIAAKIECVAADMGGVSVYKYKPPHTRFGIVVGSEAHGVSKGLLAACKDTVSLPMQNGVESLNAAVSASVMMYVLGNR